MQELIAPILLRFYDQSWNDIGTRYALRDVISSITRINENVLGESAFGARQAMRSASVAQKMTWAAGRFTTRPEDIAYCLLGIFEINMPLLYGEGKKAFQRLQEEIMRVSDDQTILAWGFKQAISSLWGESFALAQSPSDFAACSDLVSFGAPEPGDFFSMTQRGLQLHLPVIDKHDDAGVLYCVLTCAISNQEQPTPSRVLAVPFLRLDNRESGYTRYDEYARMALNIPVMVPIQDLKKSPRRTAYLPRFQTRGIPTKRRVLMDIVANMSDLPPGWAIAGIYPPAISRNDLMILDPVVLGSDPKRAGGQAMLHITRQRQPSLLLIIRYSYHETDRFIVPAEEPLDKASVLRVYEGGLPAIERFVKKVVRVTVGEVLGIGSGEILDSRTSLVALGMDSISSMRVVVLLRRRTGLKISVQTLLGRISIRDVEQMLALLFRSAPLCGTDRREDGSLSFVDINLRQDVAFALADLPDDTSLLQIPTSREKWDDLEWQHSKAIDEPGHAFALWQFGVQLPTDKTDESLRISFIDPANSNQLSLKLDLKTRSSPEADGRADLK